MKIGRLLGAGLLAGLVLNIGEAVLHGVLYADATAAAMRSLGHEISGAGADTAKLVGITFVQGVLGMLIYAGVAPRWGAGPATAVRVGLVLWVLSGVYSAVYLTSGFAGLLPPSLLWQPVAWELVLYPLALIAGAALYRES